MVSLNSKHRNTKTIMKQFIVTRILTGVMLITAFLVGLPLNAYALSNALSLTLPTGSSNPGKSFTVTVGGTVGRSTWGTYNVNGQISYPANLLKVTNINKSGATFYNDSTVTPDNSAGTINFSMGNWFDGANNQNIHLFTITFQSLANGTANVNFTKGSYNTGSAQTSGGTYTITTPPAPSPSPTPKPSTSPKPSTTPKPSTPISTPVPSPTPIPETPTPEETPAPSSSSDGGLKVENVKTTITRKENTLTWSVNNPDATITMFYGTKKGSANIEGKPEKLEDGSYKLSLTGLKLGALYYYVIKASTGDDLQGATYNGSFTTRGYPVQLTVQQNELLLPEAKVIIGDRIFTANKNALVTTELGEGNYTASITPPGSNTPYTVAFAVAKKAIPSNGNPETQSLILNITAATPLAGTNSSLLVPIIGGGAALLAIAGSVVGFIMYRRRSAQDTAPSVDADLLSSSYGQELADRRANTPQPQLQSVGFDTTPVQDLPVTNESPLMAVQQNSPSLPTNEDTDPSNAFVAPEVYTPDVTAQLPLPPQPEAEIAPAYPQNSEEIIENTEQISPEISAIESTEVQEEPSAVYDEATGELDILHHHSQTFSSHPTVSEPRQ